MASREKGGRVVFIGNIPYGVSEEQICDIFGRAGQVLSFRLVHDKDSGQPKGFGFLEYADTDSAATAVRNLNDFELNNRNLRVDYSNDNRGTTRDNQNAESNRAPPPAHFNMNASGQVNGQADAPQIPPGIDLPPGVSASDAISQTIQNMPTPQLLDLISQMKHICTNNPQQATQLLAQAPQLGNAIFQALCLLNLIDPSIIQQLIVSQPQLQQQQQQPPQPILANPVPQPPQPQYQPPPQPAFAQYPPYGQTFAPTPQQVPSYQPPQPPPQPVQQAPPAGDQQAQLIAQVMALSRDQIMALAPGAREQILALRAAHGAPVV